MARYVFLAHNGEDKNQVKGFILLKWNTNVSFEFFDRSLVDPVNSKDPEYIKKCIREQLRGTSVTLVLIGEKTHQSSWVDWEIDESESRGNGLLGIKLKGHDYATVPSGLTRRGVRVIKWAPDYFEDEIEKAAVAAGR